MRGPSRPATMAGMRERERAQVPLPQGRLDRALLAVGAAALLAVIPMLWIWLLYGSGLRGSDVVAGAIALSVLAAGIGGAMIRLLDGAR
jgi:hypothetical protein